MVSPTTVPSCTPISQLNPDLRPDESSVTGIVTLIWPYASSKKTFSFLLVEPDFRLRSIRGQVRVHFQGSSAKAVARSGISSGDQLLLSLKGAQWAKDSTAATTPGKGIDWQLQFEERLELQIQRPSQQPLPLYIDHPTPSPEPSVQTSTPVQSPPHHNDFATSIGRPQLNAQSWASPAFLKRSQFLPTDYNPFADDEFPDNDRRKRTKFGRGSGQWRFTERTPSPEREPETLPLEIATLSKMTGQDRPKEEGAQSVVQQAHDTGSPSKASSVAKAFSDRSEVQIQSENNPIVEDTFVEEAKKHSTSLGQVNDGKNVICEVLKDGNVRDTTIVTPEIPHTKPDLDEVELFEERVEIDSGIARPMSPTPKTDHVDDEASEETAQNTHASPSASIEIPPLPPASPTSESGQESDEESDQESDDASHQDFDSLFDEQSSSGQSNAGMHSGPASDFGLDGSTFSRPPPPAEFAPPPSVIKRLEEGLEIDGPNHDDARDVSSPFQSDVEWMQSGAEERSTSADLAAELLLSEEGDSGQGIDMLEGHDAAQRRSSVQLPSPDQLVSSETGELDDEVINNQAAAQWLAEDRSSQKEVDILQDDKKVQRLSTSPPSSFDRSESLESHEELVLRSQEIPDDDGALEMIAEKSPAEFLEGKSPFFSQEEADLSGASDEEDTLETSSEKGLSDSAMRQEPPVTRQQEMILDTRLSRGDSRILPTKCQEARDRTKSVDMMTPKIQKPTVEIIDLESGDEDDITTQNVGQEGLQALIDINDGESTSTNEVSENESPLSLVSHARNEHHVLMDEQHRLLTRPDSTGLVLKSVAAVEEFSPVDINIEPEAHEEGGSRKQSPIARIEEALPSIEAPFQRPRQSSKERELPSEVEPRLNQSPIAETELELINIDELPATVPDSFEDTMLRSQLLTPSLTQRTNFVSQSSSISLQFEPEDDTLPTPRLTQSTSAGIIPPEPLAPPEEPTLVKTPAPPRKTSALIEKLKEMRRLSSQSPKPRSSESSVLDPWFAPKRLSQVIRDSEDESEAESSPKREAPVVTAKIIGRQLPQTPEKPLAKLFIRSPTQPNQISSIHSSPQYLPPSQPPPPGFRTNLSYFVPLATLPSHFATKVDILAIALSSTPVTRATSGPRDYNQTLYITDPTSSALQQSFITAQIFRSNNRCFPLVEKGDALLLRDFKVQPFQRRMSLLSTESGAWAVFRKGIDVQIRGPPVEFGAEERGFARGLWDWWASLSDDARKRFENAVPEHKKPNGVAKIMKSKASGNKRDVSIKKEEIEGLGVDLPGSQIKRRESMNERSLGLDGVGERDTVHESIEAPKRVLRARGAKGANGRSESARESRFGTVFTGGLGEPDETQGSAHELRDGKAYRDKR